MSTKIYNGIKFKSNNWKEVLDQLISVREAAKEIAMKKLTDKELAAFILTSKTQDLSEWDIYSELERACEAEYSGIGRSPAFVPRINFSVILYPTREGDIYGCYFGDQYFSLLEPYVTDFHYQNQTDPPDDVSDEDWEFRGKKWDELLDNRFSDTGFEFNVMSISHLGMINIVKQISKILPSVKRDSKINEVINGTE